MTDIGGFPPDAQRIVERWNPDGLREWRDGARTGARSVHVVAVRGIEPRPILDALASFDPILDAPGGAAVVVMLLDVASVLGKDELAALDAAARDVERVVFVASGTGDHPDRDAVLARDETLLRAHSTRFADVRVLSSPDRLTAAVRAALAVDPHTTADRNARRGAVTLVERTCRQITATAKALRDGSDEAAAALRARKTGLAMERDGGRAERLGRLRADIQRARVDLLHEAGGRVRAVSATARTEIDRAGRRELVAFPARMSGLVDAATTDVDAAVERHLGELVRRAGVSGIAPPVVGRPALPSGPEPRHRGVEDGMMVVVGASAGVGLGRLAVAPISMVPALDIATIPITLALGGAAAWWLARSRRLIADRAHLRQWVSDTTAQLRSELEQRVLGRILETEAAVGARIVADCRVATVAVDEELAALDVEARRLATERSGRLTSCERDHAALTRVLDALAAATDTMEPGGVGARPTS
ncbi:Dynamin family protein [Prescottella defluvii]|uniref:hypothetical protein n=1 Tax=Prescottella defluvii TaxID=1323361 RepID=UPI00068C55DD|nr:hypothetical protein [Prescottella defluvii]